MNKKQNYIRDIAEIRSMMERSSKFLSLSGWAGILAGIYALVGAGITYAYWSFHPEDLLYRSPQHSSELLKVLLLAIAILLLALGTAVYFSFKRAATKGEAIWNPTAKQLLISMAIPLFSGGILIIMMISKGLIGLAIPLSLLFYGLALFNACKYTYREVQLLGIVEIALGLVSCYFQQDGLLFWTLGFGLAHIMYGIHMKYKYSL